MAQLLFESMQGPAPEDGDVFQCGRCKRQFLAMDAFVGHKAECGGAPRGALLVQNIQAGAARSLQTDAPCGSDVFERAILIQPAALAGYPQSLVLTDADLLRLSGLDPGPQHLIQQAPGVQQAQTLELSIVDDAFVSRPVILARRQPAALSGLVFDVGGAPRSAPEPPGEAAAPPAAEAEPGAADVATEVYGGAVEAEEPPAGGEEEESKKDQKLKCSYCRKCFAKNFDLRQHVRCHTGEKPFQCIVCGRAFAQKSNVKKHMQTHKVWPDGLARTLPRRTGSEDGEAAGDDPGAGVPCSSESDRGKSGPEVDKNSYACPYCTYIGKSYYKLKSHMKQHDTEKVYRCIVGGCGRLFGDLDPFLEHTRAHESERTYRCHECGRSFPSLCDLGTHQLTHSLYPGRAGRRAFRCSLCLNKYSTPAALEHHLATSSHAYPCPRCDKVFPCERYLRRHLAVHARADAFACPLCAKGFKTEGYLKVHMLVHSRDKPHACAVCRAAFNRKDKLKRHLLIHEPLKRYKCPFRTRCGCPREFNRPDKLKAHILTHSCVKPFACKTCGKNFTRKSGLHDHVQQSHDEGGPRSAAGDAPEDGGRQRDAPRRPRLRRQAKRAPQALGSHGIKRRRGRPSRRGRGDGPPEMADDIPTAHIEIISESGDLVASAELISLPGDLDYGGLHFDGAEAESAPPQTLRAELPAGADSPPGADPRTDGS